MDEANGRTTHSLAAKFHGPKTIGLDLIDMPQGQRYEDRYQGYLDIFKNLALAPAGCVITVDNPPWCWVPLLTYLRAEVRNPRMYFDHCPVVRGAWCAEQPQGRGAVPSPVRMDRTSLEVLCSFRPETADALWKIDVQWNVDKGRVTQWPPDGEFIVTTNGAYHRPEVLEFMAEQRSFMPSKNKVVLLPCAADKPFPAPLHKTVAAKIPKSWYMATASGVVGITPQDLWHKMPHYDSGIPNEWRLYNETKAYFQRNPHDKIVVMCDFYSVAIQEALRAIGQDSRATYILPVKFYADYVDLMAGEWQGRLLDVMQRLER